MKRLLLLTGLMSLFVAAPAIAQYVYIDANTDGVCDGTDVITDQVNSIDIWIDTDSYRDGSAVTCTDPLGSDPPLTMAITSYKIILRNYGGVTWGAFTNHIPEFTIPQGENSNASDFVTGFGGTTALAPGLYKVGTLMISVDTGATPVIAPVTTTPLSGFDFTGFGTECPGPDLLYTYILGTDFADSCAPGAPTSVKATTWGAIKKIYGK